MSAAVAVIEQPAAARTPRRRRELVLRNRPRSAYADVEILGFHHVEDAKDWDRLLELHGDRRLRSHG